MKKSKKVWIIIAAILIAVGTALSLAVFAVNGFDINAFDTEKKIQLEYEFSEAVNSVAVDLSSVDVCIKKSENGTVKVKYEGRESTKVNVEVKDGALKVTEETKRKKWYEHIEFSFMPQRVTVYIPDGLSFAISTKSGNIEINGASAADIAVSAQSGDISLKSFDALALSVSSSSGNFKADGCRFTSGSAITTSSGDISLKQCDFSGPVMIKALSGDTEVKKTALYGGADITASSGNVKVTASNTLKYEVSTSSGNKKIKKSAEGSPVCKIKTKSGDVFADFVG